MPDLTTEQLGALEAIVGGAQPPGYIAAMRNALPDLIAAARELQRLRCAVKDAAEILDHPAATDMHDVCDRNLRAWKLLHFATRDIDCCSHESQRDEARALLSDLCGEAGSTLAELERLRAIERNANAAKDVLRRAGVRGSRVSYAVVGDALAALSGGYRDA